MAPAHALRHQSSCFVGIQLATNKPKLDHQGSKAHRALVDGEPVRTCQKAKMGDDDDDDDDDYHEGSWIQIRYPAGAEACHQFFELAGSN